MGLSGYIGSRWVVGCMHMILEIPEIDGFHCMLHDAVMNALNSTKLSF